MMRQQLLSIQSCSQQISRLVVDVTLATRKSSQSWKSVEEVDFVIDAVVLYI